MPGGVTVSDSGLWCCAPCMSSAVISLSLLTLHRHSRPHCFRLQFTLRLTCNCVFVRVYTLSQFRELRTMSGLEQKLVLSYACATKWRVYMPLGASFLEDVPLVEFIYVVFTRMPGGVTVSDSGLCCCAPCMSSAVTSLCLLILHRHSRPYSVSHYNSSL